MGLRDFVNDATSTVGKAADATTRWANSLRKPGMPGVSATEVPWGPEHTVAFGVDPANDPSTGAAPRSTGGSAPPGASPEAQAYYQDRTANPGPQPAGAGAAAESAAPAEGGLFRRAAGKMFGTADEWNKWRSGVGDAASSAAAGSGRLAPATGLSATVGRLAGTALRKFGPWGGAYEGYEGVRDGDVGKVGLGTADTIATLGLGTPAAPIAGTYLAGRGLYEGAKAIRDGGRALYENLGDSTKDAIGGTANVVMRHLGGGVDPDAFNTLNAQARVAPNAASGAPSAAPAPNMRSGPYAPFESDFPQAPSADSDSAVTLGGKTGTAIHGAPGVRKFVTPDGRTLYSNVAGGDNDTLMSGKPGLQGFAENPNAATSNPSLRGGFDAVGSDPNVMAARRAAADRGDWQAVSDSYGGNFAGGQYGAPGGGGLRGQLQAQLAGKKLTATGAEVALAADKNDAERAASLRNYDATMYGHEVAREGHQITAANNKARLEYDIKHNIQEFNFKQGTTNFDQDQKLFEGRDKSIKDMRDEISGALPPVTDTKTGNKTPDLATASRYADGVMAQIGQRLSILDARAANGDTQAAAAAKQLRQQGPRALDEGDKARVMAGMKALDLANQYHSGPLNPIGGTGVASNLPIESLVRRSQATGDVYDAYTGGKKVAEIPARAVEKENADFFGGKHRIDLNSLIQKNAPAAPAAPAAPPSTAPVSTIRKTVGPDGRSMYSN